MLKDKLALFGGTPVRVDQFSSEPFVDEREIEAVSQTIKEGLFSRFVGSNIPGTRDALRLTSKQLRNLNQTHSFLGGPNVRKFEADWAKLHEVNFAISMNSATSCITAALLAMGIEPGDEVITTPLSFTATATAIVAAQGVPIFSDIDSETFCLDIESIKNAITEHTRFIVPVHWCGNAGGISEIVKIAEQYDLKVLEDSCQSPGSKYKGSYLGNHGNAGVFSFSEPKNVMTGEGGMLITEDTDIAEKCRLIRNHGEAVPDLNDSADYLKNIVGYNFRMTEVVAAIGRVQTSKLSEVNNIRKNNYNYLLRKLKALNIEGLYPQHITNPDSFYAYTAAFKWDYEKTGIPRNTIVAALRSEGIPVASGVGRLLSDNPIFLRKIAFGSNGWPFTKHDVKYSSKKFTVAHKVHDKMYLGFFLCGYPNTNTDMDHIVESFMKINNNLTALKEYANFGEIETFGSDRGRGN